MPHTSPQKTSRARLRVEVLEGRSVPATNLFAVGADAGYAPHVKVYDSVTRQEVFSFLAYDEGFRGGVRVAIGDYNGDGNQDIITGAGPGAGPHVRVFDGLTLNVLANFFAYDPGFRGGVTVAAGEFVRGSGEEIVTGAGIGGGSHVKVFNTSGAEYASFAAFDSGFQGSISVATGNTTARDFDSIVVGAGAGAPGGHVKVFGPVLVPGPPRPSGGLSFVIEPFAELQSFLAFAPTFTGGVSVAVTYIDGGADILVGAGPGAPGGHVKAFGTGSFTGSSDKSVELFSFLPFPTAFVGGARVASANVNGDFDWDVLISPGSSPLSVPQVMILDGPTRAPINNVFPFGTSYRGGLSIGSVTP